MSQILDYRALRRLAGATSFHRGEEYAAGGRVQGLVESEDSIAGQVRGTRRYDVRLWVDAGSLEYACTCPIGADGAFCKHCVAVGIAWLEPNGKRFRITHIVETLARQTGNVEAVVAVKKDVYLA